MKRTVFQHLIILLLSLHLSFSYAQTHPLLDAELANKTYTLFQEIENGSFEANALPEKYIYNDGNINYKNGLVQRPPVDSVKMRNDSLARAYRQRQRRNQEIRRQQQQTLEEPKEAESSASDTTKIMIGKHEYTLEIVLPEDKRLKKLEERNARREEQMKASQMEAAKKIPNASVISPNTPGKKRYISESAKEMNKIIADETDVRKLHVNIPDDWVDGSNQFTVKNPPELHRGWRLFGVNTLPRFGSHYISMVELKLLKIMLS